MNHTSPQIVSIADPSGGATARIFASLGFNCFSWRPELTDGPREMLWAHPEFSGGGERPSGSGIPLLFPFPGRIGGAKFSFGGCEYSLEPGDSFGNAIHGFVYNRSWRVVERHADRVAGEFHASRDDPAVLARWPADFRIRVSYQVRDRELICDLCYENTGDGPLPCGLGTHSYFRLPLADGGDAEQTLVRVSAAQVWEADQMLPTGRRMPAEGELDLASGGPLAGRKFDTYFTDLRADAGGLLSSCLADQASGRCLKQTFSRDFDHCVVYTPPHREAICLEPYTCVPDPFRLMAEGHPTGLQILQPGESFQTTIRIAVEEAEMQSTESEQIKRGRER